MGQATKRVFGIISLLLLVILACQPGPAPTSTASAPAVGIEEALTITVQILTARALTLSLPTPIDVVQTVPVTFTLQATDLTTIPPTEIVVPSATVPIASASVATSCRTGPGQVYDRIAVVDVGMVVQVIGRYTPDNYWIVRMSNGSQCWLWGKYATTMGDLSALPEFALPPTPLPPVGSISGIIETNTGSPVANATVTAQLAKRTSTTSDCRYLFDNLPTATEFIAAEGSSYNPKFQSVNVSKNSTVTADFILTKGTPFFFPATVEGKVLFNSSPVAGVTVRIWNRFESAVTDSNGHYGIKLASVIFLVLAGLGNLRGGVEVNLPANQTTAAPDIILSSR